MTNEEMEEMEEAEEEKTAETEKTIELDFALDPAERLKIEIANTEDANNKKIGAYLLEQFAKDEPLKSAYRERKITLKAVGDFVMNNAKKMLNSKNGFLEDEVVYGWVLHFVQDEEVKIPETETYTLTELDKDKAKKQAIAKYEAEELEKIRKAEQRKADAEKRKLEKELQKEKDSGQMNLFEGLL